ncbi:MAG: hypothetical protein KKC20_25665 [Proteobacteria bacterium]|jgi:hypothetical protein|nr:hypothetical protein [Pseudomonadota bacterium]
MICPYRGSTDIISTGDIERIFKSTDIEPDEEYNFSLHQLRRDVQRCLGTGIYQGKGDTSIWPGILTILAGIDLLTTYYDPIASPPLGANNNEKYKGFCNQNMNLLIPQMQDAFYQFRCGMLHDFSLISTTLNKRSPTTWFFKLEYKTEMGDYISYDSQTNYYTVYVFPLYKAFETAVSSVKNKLLDSFNNSQKITEITNAIHNTGIIYHSGDTSACAIFVPQQP